MSELEDVRIVRVLFAGVSKVEYCDCPNAKVGVIDCNPQAHLPNCRFRKKWATGRFTTDTWVSTDEFLDGYSLGVARN